MKIREALRDETFREYLAEGNVDRKLELLSEMKIKDIEETIFELEETIKEEMLNNIKVVQIRIVPMSLVDELMMSDTPHNWSEDEEENDSK